MKNKSVTKLTEVNVLNRIPIFQEWLILTFFRCFRSNVTKAHSFFDDETIRLQLQYSGVLDSVKIQKASYIYRFTFKVNNGGETKNDTNAKI